MRHFQNSVEAKLEVYNVLSQRDRGQCAIAELKQGMAQGHCSREAVKTLREFEKRLGRIERTIAKMRGTSPVLFRQWEEEYAKNKIE